MTIAFISRATLHSSPGGDTKQMDMTAECLRRLGVNVVLHRCDEQIDYRPYDLLHFFNIIRPADIMYHIRKSGKPCVVSTIFLDYGDYEKKARKGFAGLITRLLSKDRTEWVKAIARRIMNGEKLMSPEYLWIGHRQAVRWVAEHAEMLLPNSESENRRFVERYGVKRPYRVIPNGIDKSVATRVSEKDPAYEGAILCVARIEGRKNQLGLIRATRNTGFRVFVHGKPSPNNAEYYQTCRQEATPNIRFTTWLSEEELYAMYHSARVHILPSFFETTGLSSLEAAVMGCNIVVTDRGDTRDYFGDDAWYCEPEDPDSIREAIRQASEAPYDPAFRERILRDFTWDRAAEETLKAYREVLHRKG